MATVKKIKMIIPQGTTYEHTFGYYADYDAATDTYSNPIDLSGYEAELQFRVDIEDTAAFYTVTDVTGEIVCGVGTVVVTIPHADSTLWTDYSFVGAIEITSPTDVRTRIVDLEVELSRETVR